MVEEASANYEVLYRRMRPRRFEDVVGQEHITKPLQKALRRGEVPHAIILAGRSGCGKTTIARIIAAVLNCLEPELVGDEGIEPCGHCSSCRGVAEGNASLGLEELDAASNRSIEGVRSIIASASVSSMAKYKVFLIDECHALTPDAIRAFLKTIEEPPPGVVFILATTDPDKVPEPIRNRTTMYTVRALSEESMRKLVTETASKALMALTPSEVDSVVLAARGSAREAMSALERVAAGADVAPPKDASAEIAGLVAQGKVSDLLFLVERLITEGADPKTTLEDLTQFYRSALLLTQGIGEATPALKQELADRSPFELSELVLSLADEQRLMRDSAVPRIHLEACLLKLASADFRKEEVLSKLVSKVAVLEGMLVELLKRPAGVAPAGATSVAHPSPGLAEEVTTADSFDLKTAYPSAANEVVAEGKEQSTMTQPEPSSEPSVEPLADPEATQEQEDIVAALIAAGANPRMQARLSDPNVEIQWYKNELWFYMNSKFNDRFRTDLEELVRRTFGREAQVRN